MTTRLLKPGKTSVSLAVSLLRSGATVALPTETVYGLAANALDPAACAGIFEAKRRPSNDPLIVHVADLEQAEKLARFNPAARALASKFWPGPLTLVLPRKACVPDIVTSGKTTVALRVPAHPLFREILLQSGLPLAAPSANPFGYVSPTTAAHVRAGLGGRIPLILDGGPCGVGVESTILDLTRPSRPRLLRPGGIGIEVLEKALGRKASKPRRVAHGDPAAPGMLPWHYSPTSPLKLVAAAKLRSHLADAPAGTRYLAFGKRPPSGSHKGILLPAKPAEAARGLFAALRELDAHKPPLILAALPPGTAGLWRAVQDRLTKASARAQDLPAGSRRAYAWGAVKSRT